MPPISGSGRRAIKVESTETTTRTASASITAARVSISMAVKYKGKLRGRGTQRTWHGNEYWGTKLVVWDKKLKFIQEPKPVLNGQRR